jgi:hypothetical protein
VNPLTPVQETLCQLQNETSASNPSAVPQRSVNLYYMVKLQIRSGEGENKGLLQKESLESIFLCKKWVDVNGD